MRLRDYLVLIPLFILISSLLSLIYQQTLTGAKKADVVSDLICLINAVTFVLLVAVVTVGVLYLVSFTEVIFRLSWGVPVISGLFLLLVTILAAFATITGDQNGLILTWTVFFLSLISLIFLVTRYPQLDIPLVERDPLLSKPLLLDGRRVW